MTRYHFFASFVLVMVACGPTETLAPNNDAGTSTNDAGKMCAGVCLPGPRPGWDGPFLLWTGKEADAPSCDDVAGGLGEVYHGYGYPAGTPLCGVCTCAPPSGSCELPTTLTTAAASCADNSPSIAHLSFDPPADWTGACTAENAIPAGKLCGGVPCVQSITSAPLAMKQGGCLPITAPNVKPPLASAIFARGCAGDWGPACTGSYEVCKPPAPGPEFKQCIFHEGDTAYSQCPPEYPNRNISYPDPTPSCSPCACDAPMGSSCFSSIEVSAKSSCSAPLLPTILLHEEGATCVDLPPGSALGSKSATALDYSPGKCEPSGGKPVGVVFCCQP